MTSRNTQTISLVLSLLGIVIPINIMISWKISVLQFFGFFAILLVSLGLFCYTVSRFLVEKYNSNVQVSPVIEDSNIIHIRKPEKIFREEFDDLESLDTKNSSDLKIRIGR